MNSVFPDDDYLLRSVGECKRLKQFRADLKKDKEVKKMLKQIDSDLEKTLFNDLRKLADIPGTSTKEMQNVCGYLYWAHVNWKNQMPMKF